MSLILYITLIIFISIIIFYTIYITTGFTDLSPQYNITDYISEIQSNTNLTPIPTVNDPILQKKLTEVGFATCKDAADYYEAAALNTTVEYNGIILDAICPSRKINMNAVHNIKDLNDTTNNIMDDTHKYLDHSISAAKNKYDNTLEYINKRGDAQPSVKVTEIAQYYNKLSSDKPNSTAHAAILGNYSIINNQFIQLNHFDVMITPANIIFILSGLHLFNYDYRMHDIAIEIYGINITNTDELLTEFEIKHIIHFLANIGLKLNATIAIVPVNTGAGVNADENGDLVYAVKTIDNNTLFLMEKEMVNNLMDMKHRYKMQLD